MYAFLQELSDQDCVPEELIKEEERLRKMRENANKEALQVLHGLFIPAKLVRHPLTGY